MLIKLLLIAALILFIGRKFLKAPVSTANKNIEDEDIVEAEFTVIDDNEESKN